MVTKNKIMNFICSTGANNFLFINHRSKYHNTLNKKFHYTSISSYFDRDAKLQNMMAPSVYAYNG